MSQKLEMVSDRAKKYFPPTFLRLSYRSDPPLRAPWVHLNAEKALVFLQRVKAISWRDSSGVLILPQVLGLGSL